MHTSRSIWLLQNLNPNLSSVLGMSSLSCMPSGLSKDTGREGIHALLTEK